jgi:FKBP-type peptidyl-prolyl cis-trans isomerase (trigger factor)
VEEYREEIRSELAGQARDQSDQAFEQNIIDKIVAGSTIELSDLIVEDEVDRAMERQQQQFAMYGLNFSDFLQYSGQTVDQYRAVQTEQSRKMIESAWVVETIREKEHERLELSDEEFEEAVGQEAEKQGVSVEVFRSQYLKTDHDEEHFRHDRENQKLLDWLKEVSLVTDVAPEPEEEVKDETESREEDKDELDG